MRIEPVVAKLPAEFDALRAEARAAGHHFLDRLANDWGPGAMRVRPARLFWRCIPITGSLGGWADHRSCPTQCAPHAALLRSAIIPARGHWSLYCCDALG